MKSEKSFQRFSIATLAATIGVILWGAYVRATGSGAGCGSHWPTCNGEVIHRPESLATLIELTHRATSGFALLLVVAQLVWAFRLFPKGHVVRLGAALSMFFMITEALVGAGLVLFELVAKDASIARGASISVHLVNTFLLLGSLTLTVFWAYGGRRITLRGSGGRGALLVAGLVGCVVVGMSGAIAALGDTLFPAASFREGLAADLSSSAHLFVRLRGLHPFLAGGLAVLLLAIAGPISSRAAAEPSRAASLLTMVVVAQVAAGLVNLVLLAPVWMQIIHLLLADFVWIALVVVSAEALSEKPVAAGRAVEEARIAS